MEEGGAPEGESWGRERGRGRREEAESVGGMGRGKEGGDTGPAPLGLRHLANYFILFFIFKKVI